MCLPSVLGLEEARLASPFMKRCLPLPSLVFQSWLPLVSRHRRTMSVPSSLVRKIRSFQMAGVELPMPGSFAVQARFFFKLHCAGRLVSPLMPSRFGPLHWGQFSAWATAATAKNTNATLVNKLTRLFMAASFYWWAGSASRTVSSQLKTNLHSCNYGIFQPEETEKTKIWTGEISLGR